tara:strand:+ start:10874 stop:11686 length:813 start_codon:yes stop_codon:yes gene_type:complete
MNPKTSFLKFSISNFLKISFVFLLLLTLSSCRSESKKERVKPERIVVFAAASLQNVLGELTAAYEVKYGVSIQVNCASSGTLARQIKQGALPDIFLSAHKSWLSYLDSLGFVKKTPVDTLAKNTLVLVAPKQSKMMPFDSGISSGIVSLLGKGRLSIGNPAYVPAGIYAKQALSHAGLYSSLEKRMLVSKDVRTALRNVELEEAPLGIVYFTDAVQSKKVKIVAAFLEESHEPIVYYQAQCSDKKLAKHFYTWLQSATTEKILQAYGFQK